MRTALPPSTCATHGSFVGHHCPSCSTAVQVAQGFCVLHGHHVGVGCPSCGQIDPRLRIIELRRDAA